MPIYRYRSFEEADRALWCYKPDDHYYRRVSQLFAFAFRLKPPTCRRGVFRFKSIGDAQKSGR